MEKEQVKRAYLKLVAIPASHTSMNGATSLQPFNYARSRSSTNIYLASAFFARATFASASSTKQ